MGLSTCNSNWRMRLEESRGSRLRVLLNLHTYGLRSEDHYQSGLMNPS